MSKPFVVTLHLGAHKTASTHLQHALRLHNDVLIAQNVAFYSPPLMRAENIDYMGRLGLIRDSDENPRDVLAEMKQAAGKLVISEENILALAHPPSKPENAPLYPRADRALKKLLKAAPDVQFDLFLCVRDYAPFYQSLYSQNFYGGLFQPLDRFMDGFHYETLSWSDPLGALTALANVRSVTIWRYEDYPAIGPKVIDAMIGDGAGAQVDLSSRVRHLGLSQLAAAELLRIGADQPEKIAKPRKFENRKIAADVARRYPVGSDNPKISIWTSDELAASTARYHADLDQIAAHDKVTVLSI